MYRVVAINPS